MYIWNILYGAANIAGRHHIPYKASAYQKALADFCANIRATFIISLTITTVPDDVVVGLAR